MVACVMTNGPAMLSPWADKPLPMRLVSKDNVRVWLLLPSSRSKDIHIVDAEWPDEVAVGAGEQDHHMATDELHLLVSNRRVRSLRAAEGPDHADADAPIRGEP